MKKTLIIHGIVAKVIKELPSEVKFDLAEVFTKLQYGMVLGLPISRPMPVVQTGAHEIRLHDRSKSYRVFYYVKSHQGILVFHIFEKKTQKTTERQIRLAKIRLKEMLKND